MLSTLDWKQTPQGANYWQTVWEHMRNLSKGPRLGQRVTLKEDIALDGFVIEKWKVGLVERIDPLLIKFDGLSGLLFFVPEDKLNF